VPPAAVPPAAVPPAAVPASVVNALGGRVGTTPPRPAPSRPAPVRPAPDAADRVNGGSWAPSESPGSPVPWPTGPTVAAGGATRVNRAGGPPTSLFPGHVPGPAEAPVVAPPRRRRRRWGPFLVVAALVVAGCVVGAVLLGSGGRPTLRTGTGGGGAAATATPLTITSVGVWMMNDRSPDNPDQTGLTFDGNTATEWTTDQYKTPTFGGLYSGMGLAVHLDGSHTLHQLTVDSSTQGWAAQTYVSASAPASGQAVAAWGQPTDARTGIDGSTTFTLGGTTGEWVLLWLTNLGPADQANVQELSVK
jgi:hypothetical protein